MAFGPAYFTDRVRDPMEARDSGIFARIQPAGPWSYCDFIHDGKRGVLAFWPDANGAPTPEAYGKARTCSDGLAYLPARAMPSQEALAKANGLPGMDYATSRGVTLTVPYAACSAREISFATTGFGEPSDEFAKLSAIVWEARESITLSDPRLICLVMLAVAQNYRVTAELLDDLRWLTSRDVEPVFLCMMGIDPKAIAAAGTTSPSPASASSGNHA